ncbi:MAG: hypothetical protein IMY80_01665 [Chloroflexi bacterium]|nr:hypothetical protein [Chloroflexota bacterium]
MIRFLHIGDWQLGMTRHFFSEGVQERFAQSRFDDIRELGRIAEEEDCRFMGIEIVWIPWTSKRRLQDLVALTTGILEPIVDALRVCVAHGMVADLTPDEIAIVEGK